MRLWTAVSVMVTVVCLSVVCYYVQDKYNESMDVYRTTVILYVVDAFICLWISFYRCGPMALMITSGQSNLTPGCIAATHGRFHGVHQVALVCTPSNTCFLGPTGVQIPNGISIGSAVFCIAHHRVSLYFTSGLPLPP